MVIDREALLSSSREEALLLRNGNTLCDRGWGWGVEENLKMIKRVGERKMKGS